MPVFKVAAFGASAGCSFLFSKSSFAIVAGLFRTAALATGVEIQLSTRHEEELGLRTKVVVSKASPLLCISLDVISIASPLVRVTNSWLFGERVIVNVSPTGSFEEML